jgi:hypothetical protein
MPITNIFAGLSRAKAAAPAPLSNADLSRSHPSRAHIDTDIGPNAAAQDRLAGKRITPTNLDTQGIASLPLAAREAGFFSAKVSDARTLSEMKSMLSDALAMPRDKAFVSRDAFIADMRRTMGYGHEEGRKTGDTGQLTDIGSARRLGLIYDTQIKDAFEHARYVSGDDPDILDEFPAQELLRVSARKTERDWSARWQQAGGKIYGGRMIARKDDPVWTAISTFGNPWPPFDFGSGMGVLDVDREEAEELGVIKPDENPKPLMRQHEEALEKSAKDIDPEMREKLRSQFAEAVEFDGDKVLFHASAYAQAQAQAEAEEQEYLSRQKPKKKSSK